MADRESGDKNSRMKLERIIERWRWTSEST